MIAASGSFDVTVDDGAVTRTYSAQPLATPGSTCRPWSGASSTNFSSGSVALVLASEHYQEADYYRDYDEFRSVVRGAA